MPVAIKQQSEVHVLAQETMGVMALVEESAQNLLRRSAGRSLENVFVHHDSKADENHRKATDINYKDYWDLTTEPLFARIVVPFGKAPKIRRLRLTVTQNWG